MLLSGFAFVSLALTLPQPEPKKGSLYILKAEKAAGKGPQHFPSSFFILTESSEDLYRWSMFVCPDCLHLFFPVSL